MEQVFKRTKQLTKKITDAYQLQTKYWRHINKSENKKSEDGLSFFNNKYATCYKCGEKGHISSNFPKNNKNKIVTTIKINTKTETDSKQEMHNSITKGKNQQK